MTLSAQSHARSSPAGAPARLNARRSFRRAHARHAAIIVTALFACIAIPFILSGSLRARGAYDHINYHEKVVRTFAEQLPRPDFKDYLSATTPGYHLVIAIASRVALGADLHAGEIIAGPGANPVMARQRMLMQAVGTCFTLAWFGVLAWWLTSRIRRAGNPAPEPAPELMALTAMLPLVCSPYVLQSGVWLLPDNAAWLVVTAVLLLALRRPTVVALLAMGAGVFLAVWMRQIHLWTAGLVWASAWLAGSLPTTNTPPNDDPRPLLSWRDLLPARFPTWLVWLFFGFALTLPAVASIAWFYQLWGNRLAPPTFKDWYGYGQIQTGTAAFTLTLTGLYSIFFLGRLWPALARAWQQHRAALMLAAALGLAISLVGPTSESFTGGRWGGIWSLIKLAPTVSQRSLAVSLGATAGAIAVCAWLAAMPRRERWLMLAALGGFAASQTFNEQLWQRYHEPFVLAWIAIASTLATAHLPAAAGRWLRPAAVLGPVALAALLAAWTSAGVLTSGNVVDEGWRLGHVQTPPNAPQPPQPPK